MKTSADGEADKLFGKSPRAAAAKKSKAALRGLYSCFPHEVPKRRRLTITVVNIVDGRDDTDDNAAEAAASLIHEPGVADLRCGSFD